MTLINDIIEPFEWIDMRDGKGTVSLDAGSYREIFFQRHSEQFECDNGNGYDWEYFAEMYLESCFPEMIGKIQFDSEADEFCMYSDERSVLEEFSIELKKVTDDLENMEEIWSIIGERHKVYVALEHTSSKEVVLSYVGVTKLPLEDRLLQHQIVGRNFISLLLVDSFPDSDMARGYEEVIEEIMTNPMLNKGHLFINQNNSIHPYADKDRYENAITVAIGGMRQRGHMSQEGSLVVLDNLLTNFDVSTIHNNSRHKDQSEHQVAPFGIMKLDNGMFSACLDTISYKKEIFSLRSEEGIMGSGYDWNKVAGILLRKYNICKSDSIYFSSEADLFCAYSKNLETLQELVTKMKELCENDIELKRIVMDMK